MKLPLEDYGRVAEGNKFNRVSKCGHVSNHVHPPLTIPLELFSRVTGAGGLFNPKEGIIRGWLGQKPFVIIYQHKLAEVIRLPVKGTI